MRIAILFTLVVLLLTKTANSQAPSPEESGDTVLLNPVLQKLGKFFFRNPDSALHYATLVYDIGVKMKNYPVTSFGLQMMGEAYTFKGEFPRAIRAKLEAKKLNTIHNDKWREAYTNTFIGYTYINLGDYQQALKCLLPARTELVKAANDWIFMGFNSSNIGYCYTMLDMPDSASFYNRESIRLLDLGNESQYLKSSLRNLIYDRLGQVLVSQGKLEEAISNYRMLIESGSADSSLFSDHVTGQLRLARIYVRLNSDDSALLYASRALENSYKESQSLGILQAASLAASIYKKRGNSDSSLHYLTIANALNDSIYGVKDFSELQLLALKDQQDQQDLIAEKTAIRNTLSISLVAVVAVALLVITLILRRNNKVKLNVNRQLELQKTNLESTLKELRSTQAQLIQSEKMASLGELTAGIAHEIQNPLNFVNNFSEINKDLLNEMKKEIDAGSFSEAKDIAGDIISNEEKINYHGKRADAIVKGMLQHSRKSEGTKEPTDINALADEYFRLAYHGFRAKDKSFNAKLETDFDPAIGRINIVPQDMGRVLLNVINNALFAVQEKQMKKQNQEKPYEPTVAVSTKKEGEKISITVTDNGSGIPKDIIDKIFQPFFTPRPAGQGTGLGLSLAYDIVKAHGGEIFVRNLPGQGAEFVITFHTNS
ncbi:ATP-binding protein [Pollutibacter soli]|uniref:tetratricopeptide repeat-containing sensor histidine kinase n=1 Tax=Pollutibacter soli TaxID=3034157 RepID=UPI003013C48B